MVSRSIALSLLSCIAVVSATSSILLGQENESGASGRLPPYYKEVVSAAQKTTIYKIQSQYDEKLATLETQYEDLTAQIKKVRDDLESIRDQERAAIEKVLSPKQLATVKRKQAEAQSRLAQELLKAAEEAAKRAEELSQPGSE